MDIFDILTMIGGLALFLFGMDVMGKSLERRAGSQLRGVLEKLTTGKTAGLLTGLGITAIVQSSSATTVMVVGFVNSGLMTLKQAINVIMGANIGTTVTAWILSLAGISSDSIMMQLLKPTSFTPVLALIGIVFLMFSKKEKRQDTGHILLGFATLMFGMETMATAVAGLSELHGFQQLFILFENPLLGVLAGALLTAAIQSSSASVGILQALASTGQVTIGSAVPIIMGQNIGTCITAIISSIGTNKNARRAALIHLSFNVIGTAFGLVVFKMITFSLSPKILGASASLTDIAIIHSAFNILCTLLLLPFTDFLEKIALKLIPGSAADESEKSVVELDERLLTTPSIALERCHLVIREMAECSAEALRKSISCINDYSEELHKKVKKLEKKTDHFEDILGTYLVKLSALPIGEAAITEAAEYLTLIDDFERIADHAVNLTKSAQEIHEKEIVFSKNAQAELKVLFAAMNEILDITLIAFEQNDVDTALKVEPLEQVIDGLKHKLRSSHTLRLQNSICSIEAGFVWSDILTSTERASDHCSNIAGCIIDISHNHMNIHKTLKTFKRHNDEFMDMYSQYSEKYSIETE